MLVQSDSNSQCLDIELRRLRGMNRNTSLPIPMNSIDSYESEKNHVSHTGPLQNNRRTSSVQMSGPLFIRSRPENFSQPMNGIAGQKSPALMEGQLPPSNGMEEKDWSNNDFTSNSEHLLNYGPLGACNDPYCTTCLSYNNFEAAKDKNKSRDSTQFDPKLQNAFYEDAKGWAMRISNFLHPFIPSVMNPHAKVVQQWNKFFVIACLVAIFIDPLFFFLLTVQEDNKCIVLDLPLTTALVILRTITDFIYFLHMLLQKISTFAGNQIPSYFVWEVLFSMAIIGLGLLLFALLIGNMQNFLQALGKRRLDLQLRRRDVEQWMRYRHLPEELRRKVRASERFNWSVTRGVDEEILMKDLPEDLLREIRRHLFKFIKKVRIFSLIEDPILDAIRERIRQNIYIQGSRILNVGDPIEKMVFIVRGKLESIGGDWNMVQLSEGDVCGEELLTWCLENSSMNKDGQRISIPGLRLLSNRMVRCSTNVEAFSLRASDLEEVTARFARLLRNPRVQRAIRYESPYWRTLAAFRVQVAWRYRKKRLNRLNTSNQELQETRE